MNVKTNKLKIMTILGTRPEIIRLSRVMAKLDEYVAHTIIYTQQSFDYELSKIFFEELEIRKPNYILDVKADTLGMQIGNILSQTEKIMLKEKPDALLVLGDTNTTLCAIVAKRLGVPVFHMEAGNRCFDFAVPEETNRAVVDAISDYNFPYTEYGRRYLMQQGVHPSKIFVTGSPMAEVYAFYKEKIDKSSVLQEAKLTKNNYFVVSVHRGENVDDDLKLKKLFDAFHALAETYALPILITVHPRTKKRMENKIFIKNNLIQLHKPFGIVDYITLEKNALCVLSDSGTIQEESAMLDFSAVQLRENLERPEAFDNGIMILTGLRKDNILNAVALVIDQRNKKEKVLLPYDYQDTNVSSRVTKLIMSLTAIHKNANW